MKTAKRICPTNTPKPVDIHFTTYQNHHWESFWKRNGSNQIKINHYSWFILCGMSISLSIKSCYQRPMLNFWDGNNPTWGWSVETSFAIVKLNKSQYVLQHIAAFLMLQQYCMEFSSVLWRLCDTLLLHLEHYRVQVIWFSSCACGWQHTKGICWFSWPTYCQTLIRNLKKVLAEIKCYCPGFPVHICDASNVTHWKRWVWKASLVCPHIPNLFYENAKALFVVLFAIFFFLLVNLWWESAVTLYITYHGS